MTHFSSFGAVNAPGVTLYRKPRPSAAAGGAGAFASTPLEPPAPVTYTDFSVPDRPTIKNVPPTLAPYIGHADEGAWENAARGCEQLLKTDNLNSAVHFYHALVLEQMGRHDDAERSLRRAIYLDRQSVLAHYYLGLFLQSRGDGRRAERSFENALDLLRSRGDADIFADADGITVAELRKLTKMHIEILGERV